MTSVQSRQLRTFTAVALAASAITLRAAPAAAVTSFADVTFTNNTACPLDLQPNGPNGSQTTLSVGGEWTVAPPATIQGHQTVTWTTDSNHGGAFSGTGGTIVIHLPTGLNSSSTELPGQLLTLYWSVPWGYFNGGLDGILLAQVNANKTAVANSTALTAQPASAYSISGGPTGCGQNDHCGFSFTLAYTGINSSITHAEPCTPPTTVSSAYAPFQAPSTVPAGFTGYWDPKHGTQYEFYEDTSGAIDTLSCGSGGCWVSQQVAPPGWFTPGSSLVSYFDGTNGHLFFQGPGGFDIMELKGNPPSINGTVTDVTAAAGGAPWASYTSYQDAHGNPVMGIAPMSNLTGYSDGTNNHIFYCDGAMNIHESYYNGSWWDHVVASAGAFQDPPLGTLQGIWDGTNQNIFYTIGHYNVQESTIVSTGLAVTSYPSNGWTPAILDSTNVPGANFIPMNPGSNGWDYVFGSLSNGEIGWWYNLGYAESVSASNSIPEAPLLSYEDSQGTELFYIGLNQHIYRYGAGDMSTGPGNDGALAASTNQGYASNFSPLVGYYDGYNDHVFFVDTLGNVQEFYWQPGGSVTEHPIGGGGNVVLTGSVGGI